MKFLRKVPLLRAAMHRIDQAIRWRVEENAGPLRDEVNELRTELARLRTRADWTANEMERLQPHVAALDARVEDLRIVIDDHYLRIDEGDGQVARKVLDEIRAEHASIRARLSAAAIYEERMRRLEEAVAERLKSSP